MSQDIWKIGEAGPTLVQSHTIEKCVECYGALHFYHGSTIDFMFEGKPLQIKTPHDLQMKRCSECKSFHCTYKQSNWLYEQERRAIDIEKYGIFQ